jgi:hypothetical protein
MKKKAKQNKTTKPAARPHNGAAAQAGAAV